MNVLLQEPRTVLSIAGTSSNADLFESHLTDDGIDDVAHRESIEQGRTTLAERSDVGCIVISDDIGTDGLLEFCGDVREIDADLPIVVLAADGDESLAQRATVAGASTYLPADAIDELPAVLARELDEYVRRRTDAMESNILDALLTRLEIPLYVKDANGRHLKMADIRGGVDPDAVIGKTDLEVYGDDETVLARETYQDDMQVIEEEQPVLNREESHGPEGNAYWSRTTKVPWYDDDGTVKGLVGASQNITELKQKEKRLEEIRGRFDQFANNLRHDLQNPVQVASGYLDMARESGDQADFDRVAAALERMEEMIDDLETIATLRGPSASKTTTFSLAELVTDVWSLLGTGDASLTVEIPDDYVVHAEKEELRPLFENLLKNAVDHGISDDYDAETIDTTVAIRVGLTDTGGFYVEDNGPGIPEQDRDKVMDEGYTTAADGTGTGLSIVRDITGRNGWHVSITDSADGGARFEITNCLGVHERDPPRTKVELELSETTAVGNHQKSGDTEYDAETDQWTVAGDGEDIWRQNNDFQFAYTAVDGPVRIEGRIVDVEHVADYTKAGFMILDDLEDAATYGYAGTTPGRGTELLWRTRWGEDGTSQQLEADPFAVDWYRVERVGDRITTYLSTDGNTWEPVDERWVELTDPVYVGLAVCSIVPGVVAEATFGSVSVQTLDT